MATATADKASPTELVQLARNAAELKYRLEKLEQELLTIRADWEAAEQKIAQAINRVSSEPLFKVANPEGTQFMRIAALLRGSKGTNFRLENIAQALNIKLNSVSASLTRMISAGSYNIKRVGPGLYTYAI